MARMKKSSGLSDAAYEELQGWLLDRKLTLENVKQMLIEKHGLSISVSALKGERDDVKEEVALIKATHAAATIINKETGELSIGESAAATHHMIQVALHRCARTVAMGDKISPGDVVKLAGSMRDMNNALDKGLSNEQRLKERAAARAELLKEQSEHIKSERARGVLTAEQEKMFREKLGLS
jgi:hypothetical protein